MTLFLTFVLIDETELHRVVEKQANQYEVREAKGSCRGDCPQAWGRGQRRQGGL